MCVWSVMFSGSNCLNWPKNCVYLIAVRWYGHGTTFFFLPHANWMQSFRSTSSHCQFLNTRNWVQCYLCSRPMVCMHLFTQKVFSASKNICRLYTNELACVLFRPKNKTKFKHNNNLLLTRLGINSPPKKKMLLKKETETTEQNNSNNNGS